MPPKSTSSTLDDKDKELLMRIAFKGDIKVSETCKEIAKQTGTNAETWRPGKPIEHIIMPVSWNPETERLLFLALLDRDRQGGWEEIAKILGGKFTASAIRWDDAAERKLLLFVIKRCETKPEPSVFENAAAIFGGEFSANACYQRFYKLKREADELIAKSGTGSDNSAAAPQTPSNKKSAAKPKGSAKSTAKSTGRGRKRKVPDDEMVIDETSDIDESPSKKVKEEEKVQPVANEAASEEDDE